MSTSETPRIRYAGIQSIAWGAVDGVIATVGIVLSRRAADTTRTDDEWKSERRSTRRVFLINAALDVAYVLVGTSLLAFGKSESLIGTGAGVLAQGGFLLTFDSAGSLVMGR